MKQLATCLALTCLVSSCEAQNSKKTQDGNGDSIAPQTDIQVNREYDEDGNLIRFDSTYTYFYSNVEGNPDLNDSLFQQFRQSFQTRNFFSESPFSDSFLFNDSVNPSDFYQKDYFSEMFRQQMEEMNRMIQEMDSLKNNFYQDQYEQHRLPEKKGKNTETYQL